MNVQPIKHAFKEVVIAVSKRAPAILTGMAVGGVVLTGVLSGTATIKAGKVIAELEEATILTRSDNGKLDKDGWITVIKSCWKYYIPAGLTLTTTIACILGANHIHADRTAALATAYSLSERALKEYEQKVVEQIGANKAQKIKDDISQDCVNANPVENANIIYTGKGETLCLDSLTGRYFKSNIEDVRHSINLANEELLHEGWLSQNEFYYQLGLDGIAQGDQLGWYADRGLIDVNFSSNLTTGGEPCLVLNYRTMPKHS